MSSARCSDQRSPAPLPEVHPEGQGGPLVEAESHSALQNSKSVPEDQVHFTEGKTEVSKSPERLRPCGAGGWLSRAPAELAGSEPQARDPLGRAGESPGCGHAEPAVCLPPRSRSRLRLQEAV